MIKFLFLVVIFLVMGYLFNPYLTSLVNYVSFGLSKIVHLIEIMGDILVTFLGSLTQYNYIMLMMSIFICVKVLFYIIDVLRGSE